MSLVAAAGLALAVVAADPPPPPAWPPPGTAWTMLRLEAKKSVFRGSVELRAERRAAADALTDLREWPEGGARKPDGEVAVFDLRSQATFRGKGERRTWSDARGLLQDEGRDGKRESIRRFGADGFHRWRRRGESIEERHVRLEAPADRPLVDLGALLWLAMGLRLDREGAVLRVAVVSKGRVVPLDVEARETATWSDGRLVRRVLLHADEDEEASFLGLQGDVDLWLDAADGSPLELQGRVARLGAVRVRVVALERETAP